MSDEPINDNQQKSIAGKEFDTKIKEILDSFKEQKIIKDFQSEVNFGHEKFTYKKQFLANFFIETSTDKFIVVRRSKSFRLDRIKIGFYDILGILEKSECQKDIIASVYIVSDDELKNDSFIKTREQIARKEFYSPVTHLLTYSEFLSFLNEHKLEIEQSFSDSIQDTKEFANAGSFAGFRGNEYERHLTEILNSQEEFKNLRKGLAVSSTYELVVSKILNEHKIDIEEIARIESTNSIPLLKSGGNPKTDILVSIHTLDGNITKETMSLKYTNSTSVSCHDYTAKDFFRVLAPTEKRLEYYFNHFQNNPSMKSFVANIDAGYSKEEFEKLLKSLGNKFSEWVLTGQHDLENLNVPDSQISNLILLKSDIDIKIYTFLEYQSLLNSKAKKTFGVPFRWTYPSKQRGKRIQLKIPIYFN